MGMKITCSIPLSKVMHLSTTMRMQVFCWFTNLNIETYYLVLFEFVRQDIWATFVNHMGVSSFVIKHVYAKVLASMKQHC
jgi:hypothetical protein